MKKFVSILLAAVLTLGLVFLTGCGEGGDMTTSKPSSGMTTESSSVSESSRESSSSSRESTSEESTVKGSTSSASESSSKAAE
ncbi:MAG: hypothetical protein Q4D20_05150 [Clostridia bacterium]|nr:hypothetical protein [Clostridia bacterium]